MVLGLSRREILAQVAEKPRGNPGLGPAVSQASDDGRSHSLLWLGLLGRPFCGQSKTWNHAAGCECWHHTHELCDLPKVLNPSVAPFPPPYRGERQGLASMLFVQTE